MNAISAMGWALLHFLWQGILIALLTRIVLSMLSRRHAPLRYAIAVGALISMPATVVISIVRGVGGPATTEVAEARPERAPSQAALPPTGNGAPLAALEAPPPSRRAPDPAPSAPVLATVSWKQRIDGVLPWIVGAWAIGVVALAVRLLSSYSAVRRLVRTQGEAVPESVTALLQRLAVRLRVGRAVRVCSSGRTLVPAVAGWLTPVVLLPASALSGLSRSELEAILAHELAHVKRHDYLVNLLQTLIETLLFYHPAVWWLGARIREEREHCCDDLAVAACGSAPVYAEALLSMERLRGAPELAMALSGGSLLARIERLLAPHARTPELFPRWIAGMSAVAIVLVLVATSGLSDAAQRTQDRTTHGHTGAHGVFLHPDQSQPLASRNEWARKQASERGFDEFWIGHSIAPPPFFPQGILIARFDHTGGLVLKDDGGEGGITLMGGVVTTGDFGGLSLPGVPLAPLVGADPAEIGVLYLWSARSDRPVIRRVHVATAGLAVDFEGLPLLWLGRADDGESVRDALASMERAETPEIREEFVGAVGAHGTSTIVVPELTRILSTTNLDAELRGAAAQWLARHPDPDALRALERAARGDRSGDVRREAAEAVGEMRYAPAFDVLVALAHELKDRDARRAAVEGLSQRTEPGAVAALVEIANGDRDEDIQREAVESLGEAPDGAGLNALASIAHAHRSTEVRREAVETYGECAPADQALGFLQDLARRDRSSDVRREAVETLGEVHDERVVGILTELAEGSDDLEVQREAVETLGETVLGAEALPVLDRIARTHPVLEVRREAVETLGELHDERVVGLLTALAEGGDDPDVQCEAVETLGETIQGAEVMPVLDRIARTHPVLEVRREAVETLGELHDERVVGILTELAESGDDLDVQREAVETLGETILGAEVAPVLERIARTHPALEIQREAVEALGDLHEEGNRVFDIVAALAADHPSEEVRVKAVETLEDCCPPESAQALYERLLKSERSPMVRRALKDALEELSEDGG